MGDGLGAPKHQSAGWPFLQTTLARGKVDVQRMPVQSVLGSVCTGRTKNKIAAHPYRGSFLTAPAAQLSCNYLEL